MPSLIHSTTPARAADAKRDTTNTMNNRRPLTTTQSKSDRGLLRSVLALVLLAAIAGGAAVAFTDLGASIDTSDIEALWTETEQERVIENDSDDSTAAATGGSDGPSYDLAGDEETNDSDRGADLNETVVEREIHRQINAERTDRDLEPLAWDSELAAIARNHSQNMLEEEFFDHVDHEGRTVADRYDAAGYECRIDLEGDRFIEGGGENIAQNWFDRRVTLENGETDRYESEEELARAVVAQWMNSEGHRENILREGWENEGIGVIISEEDETYVTENFC